jgi:hypothetical protein
MNELEMFLKLGEAYIEEYHKELHLNYAARSMGLMIDPEKRSLIYATEEILEDLTGCEDICYFIIDLDENGFVAILNCKEDGTEEAITCESLEELYNAVTTIY